VVEASPKPELKLINTKDRTPPPELPPLIYTPGYEIYNQKPPAIQWLVEGLIPRGSLFCLNGLGGTFKSWTFTALGICVAAGANFIENFACPVEVKNSVMFIQLEENKDEAARKYKWTVNGLFLEPETIQDLLMGYVVGQPFRIDDPKRMDQLKILIDDIQPDLVLWDSARKMKRGNENESEWADAIAFALKELQAIYPSAHGIVHHWRKKSPDKEMNDPGERGRGSAALRDAMDVWLPVEEQEAGFITMTHHKHRQGPKHAPFNYKVRIADSEGLAHLEFIGANTARPNMPGAGSDILKLLADNPNRTYRLAEIVAEFKESYAARTVRDAVNYLAARSQIHSPRAKQGVQRLVRHLTQLDTEDT